MHKTGFDPICPPLHPQLLPDSLPIPLPNSFPINFILPIPLQLDILCFLTHGAQICATGTFIGEGPSTGV